MEGLIFGIFIFPNKSIYKGFYFWFDDEFLSYLVDNLEDKQCYFSLDSFSTKRNLNLG